MIPQEVLVNRLPRLHCMSTSEVYGVLCSRLNSLDLHQIISRASSICTCAGYTIQSQHLNPAPGKNRENFLNIFVSTIWRFLCSFPSLSKPLPSPISVVVFCPVMLQLWRFSALGIVLALVCAVLGEETAQQVLSENAKVSNESLLWGPYRPNLYFGVRPRIPKSLMTGLIWAKVDNFQKVQNSMWL